MAEKMEILVEKRRRGARSNQKLKILYLAKILLDNTDAKSNVSGLFESFVNSERCKTLLF